MDLEMLQPLVRPAETKIVLLVVDGLGGLPVEKGGATELEAAATPHLDRLAAAGICGLQQPVAAGITPGSGPGHLALFGYDPLTYQVGRGVLSALGIGFDLTERDIAARGNFCTVDGDGRVTDRRAGRISTPRNSELCEKLRRISLAGVDVFVETVKEHRFLLVLRGDGLGEGITDTDPQSTGRRPLDPEPAGEADRKTATTVRRFLAEARNILADHHPANMVLLRGFSRKPRWPSMPDVYGLRAAAIAVYPMYRGVARLVGMESLPNGESVLDEFDTLKEHWHHYDFFYVHVKGTDSAGEDGDARRKQEYIEAVDRHLPRLLDLRPDVIVVTGDHSTPSRMRAHSWHPVPVLLWSEYCRPDAVPAFGERHCVTGGLGPRLPGRDLMPLAMAHALRLEKFGA